MALVGDVLTFKGSPIDCLNQTQMPFLRKSINQKNCDIDFSRALDQESTYEPTLKMLASQYEIPYFSLSRLLCTEKSCPMIKDGILYYRDPNHLSTEGSIFVGRILGDMILESGFLK